MTVHVISPHLDDALLGLGQYLASVEDGIVVHTVMAAGPNTGLAAYDESCGFVSSRQAMFERRLEDVAALQIVGAVPRHGPFYDHQYGITNDVVEMRAWLRPAFSGEWHTFVPVGIGHPDHEQVAAVCRSVPQGDSPVELIAFEELPRRVSHPEEVVVALRRWEDDGWIPDPVVWPLPQGDRAVKAEAIRAYASQFPNGADDDPCLLVPERCWRMIR